MATIHIEHLLQAISQEASCGDNLEYDARFSEMERYAQGKPEQQFGEKVVPGEPPDWLQVRREALELLERTKDLRVLVYLIRALLHTDGLPGFHQSVTLLRGVLDRYWGPVHPQLDPGDNDPTQRINILSALADTDAVLMPLRAAPLVASPMLGKFSLRDIEIAEGTLPFSGEGEPPTTATIDAAFTDCDLAQLQATAGQVNELLAEGNAIEALVTEQVGVAETVNLSPLLDLLAHIRKILSDRLAARGADVETGENDEQQEGEATASSSPQKNMSGNITSRQDVILMLEKACEYYKKHEPSSPVPILLKRAKRLVSMDFMDIIKDLAPEAAAQVEKIRGAQDE